MSRDAENIVTTFLNWAVLDKDYLTQVSTEDPDRIFGLIPEFLESRHTNPHLRTEAARVLTELLREYRTTFKEQPPGEQPDWLELMHRAALGEEKEEEAMSEPLTIEIFERHTRWFYEDHFMIRTPNPLPMRTEAGETFEVITIALTSAWGAKGWNLSEVVLWGTVMNGDGTYGDEVSRYFDEPLNPDGGEQRAPDWVIRLAEKRMLRVPTPPTNTKEEK